MNLSLSITPVKHPAGRGISGKTSTKASVRGPLRLQDVLFIIWAFLCKAILAYYLPRMHPTARDLFFVYFQPVAPVLMMLWLWSFNVRQFELKGIEYDICYSNREKRHLVSHTEIQKIATAISLLALTCTTAFAYLCSQEIYSIAQYLPAMLYISASLVVVSPLHYLQRPLRLFFCDTLQRALLPFQEMTWSDFLLADILTSLAKPLTDLDRAVCTLVTGPVMGMLAAQGTPQHGSGTCSPVSTHALAALCLPFVVRFVQCLGVYWRHGTTAQLFNAAKYLSALPALILTTMEWEEQAESHPFRFYHVWLLTTFAYSCYAFYWDVEQDWDMPWLEKPGGQWWGPIKLPTVKPDSLYPSSFYAWALVSNLLLRFMWLHRLAGRVQLLPLVGMAVAMLEVWRRYQWVYIRFETELRKIKLRMSHSHADLNGA